MNRVCMMLPVLVTWGLTVAAASAIQEPPPTSPGGGSPYDEALARAKKEGKYFVVVVYDADCPDCTRFDAALASPDVQEWMQHHGVLLKLTRADSTGRNFATAHNITEFPTLVVMSSAARELGRHVGHVPPKALVTMLERLSQSDRILGQGGINPWAGQDVVLSAVRRAQDLTTQGKYDDALKELRWCFGHRAARSPVFVISALPELVGALADLAQHFEPARRELLDRIAEAERETLQRPRPTTFALYLIKHGYLALGQEDKLVAHYDRMKKAQPQGVGVTDFARLIYGPLLHARRYEALRYSVEDAEDVVMFFQQARRSGRDKNEARELMAGRYEILLALGKDGDADLLAEQLLRYDKSKRALMALAQAALRSGRPTDADITRARRVYMATDAKDARSVILLAKLLALKTPKSREAVQTVQTGMTMAKTPEARSALAACLKEIRSGKVTPELPTLTPKRKD